MPAQRIRDTTNKDTAEQILVLMDLGQMPPQSIADLSRTLGIDRKNIRHALKQLENREAIEAIDLGSGKRVYALMAEMRGTCLQILRGTIPPQSQGNPIATPRQSQSIPIGSNQSPVTVWMGFSPENPNFDPEKSGPYLLYNSLLNKLYSPSNNHNKLKSLFYFLTKKTYAGSAPVPEGRVSPSVPEGRELFHLLKDRGSLFPDPPEEELSAATAPERLAAVALRAPALIKALPAEKPREPEISLENDFYRGKAKGMGLLDKEYQVKQSADINLGAWRTMLQRSDDSCFCYYVGLPQPARDMVFAKIYGWLFLKYTESSSRSGIYRDAINPKDGMKKDRWIFWQRARVWADYYNARYDHWCEAIFERYRDNPTEYAKTAFPRLLSGESARDTYNLYFNAISRMERVKRSEVEQLDSDFLPEFYRGTEKQNAYYAALMAEIERIAKANGRPIDRELSNYINQKLMPQGFAENPALNEVCPGFKYKPREVSDYIAFLRR